MPNILLFNESSFNLLLSIFGFFGLLVIITKLQDYLYIQIRRIPFFHVFFLPGVVFHEASHYLFCLLTGRRVLSAKFYKFDHNTGSLGSVSFESNNAISSYIPNMLIGIAPLITSTVLFAYILNFLPTGSNDFESVLNQWIAGFQAVIDGEVPWWLILIIFSVSYAALPSKQDFVIAWKGIVTVVFITMFIVMVVDNRLASVFMSIVEMAYLRLFSVSVPTILLICFFLLANFFVIKAKQSFSKNVSSVRRGEP